MKLFGHPLSSCTRKVLITLAEKEAHADFVLVDLFNGEQKREGHLAMHPLGVVPVLDDDGFVLLESRAIIRYLDRRLGGTSLVPTSLQESARMDQWLSIDQAYVAPHTRTLATERILQKRKGIAPHAETEKAAELGLLRAFKIIDSALGTAAYLAGPTLSLADISLMPYVGSLPMIGAEHLLANLPRLSAWWERRQASVSWKRALDAA